MTSAFPPAPARARWPSGPYDLGVQLLAVPLEHAPQLGPGRQRDHEVSYRMGGVEPDPSAPGDRQRLPGVRVVREPVPDVHESAEGKAEHAAGDGKRDATTQQRCRGRAHGSARGPRQHLPGRPRSLAEEEIGEDRKSTRLNSSHVKISY